MNQVYHRQDGYLRAVSIFVFIYCLYGIAPYPVLAGTIGQSVGIASSPNPVGSGARAVGMGGAFIAVSDDATAASWNPAGLIQLESPELSVAGTLDMRSEKFNSSIQPGSNTESQNEAFNANYFSMSLPFNRFNRNMIVSINYQRLYDFNRSLSYQTQTSVPPPVNLENVQTRNYAQEGFLGALGLAFAIEISPQLSIGVTANIWSSDLGWENGWHEEYTNHSVTRVGLTTQVEDTRITESYSDMQGLNFNLGLLWSPFADLTFGAVFKTPFSAKFDHDYEYTWVRYNGAGGVTGSGNTRTSEPVELEMPMSYGLGVAWRFSDHFTMAFDIYRTQWSDYFLVDSQGNKMSPINALPKIQSDIEDTTQFRLGGEYLFYKPDGKIVIPLRGGLFYDPEPDQKNVKDFYGASIGTGIGYKQYIFDIAYQLRWGSQINSSNIIASSNADIVQHTVLLSFVLHF
ncbi:MAG: outer membrane protein transport protein [Pseudomonadota bacterium]